MTGSRVQSLTLLRRYSSSMIKLNSIIAAGWFAVASLAIAAPAPAPEKLLPDDTLAFVTAPESAKLRSFLESSPATAYWRDPSMKAFRENFWSNIQSNAVTPLEKALLIKADDFKDLLQGQATFAVLLNGWTGAKGTDPAVVAVVDARDKADKLKETLTKLKKTWTDAGRKLRTDKIRDVEFTTWITTSGDISKLFAKAGDGDDTDKPKGSDKPVEISFGSPIRSSSSALRPRRSSACSSARREVPFRPWPRPPRSRRRPISCSATHRSTAGPIPNRSSSWCLIPRT